MGRHPAFAFVFLYLLPIGFSFFTIVCLIIHIAIRLRTIFNAALLKLLIRLIPGPVIFAFAMVPSLTFQIIRVSTGEKPLVVKKFALLGINISGALYVVFYVWACLMDNSMYLPKRVSRTGATLGRNNEKITEGKEGGDDSEQVGQLSWTHLTPHTNSSTSVSNVLHESTASRVGNFRTSSNFRAGLAQHSDYSIHECFGGGMLSSVSSFQSAASLADPNSML